MEEVKGGGNEKKKRKIADYGEGQRGKFPRTGRGESVWRKRDVRQGDVILVPVASASCARGQRVRDKTQLSAAKVPTCRQTLNKKDFPGKVN